MRHPPRLTLAILGLMAAQVLASNLSAVQAASHHQPASRSTGHSRHAEPGRYARVSAEPGRSTELSRPSEPAVSAGVSGELSCNGSPELCDRRYDQVSYATTHNAFNYAMGELQYYFPNQDFPIDIQLNYGVRAFMIDVHPYNGFDASHEGETWVCHSYCWLGGEPLVNVLQLLKDYLDENPAEVLTIIFESYVDSSIMEEAFSETGLIDYAISQPADEAWPTLREMIEANNRLVVLTDEGGGDYDWYLDVWEYAVETDYSAQQPEDLTCAYNRGDPANSLFILNHFLTYPLARRTLAAQVNFNPFLINRANECWGETGKRPNFVTLDFYAIGDLMEAVNALNEVDL